MREFLVMMFLILLVAFGWKQSYSDHLNSVMNWQTESAAPAPPPGAVRIAPPQVPPPTTGAPASQTPPSQGSSWMWRKTTMDEPYKSKDTHGR